VVPGLSERMRIGSDRMVVGDVRLLQLPDVLHDRPKDVAMVTSTMTRSNVCQSVFTSDYRIYGIVDAVLVMSELGRKEVLEIRPSANVVLCEDLGTRRYLSVALHVEKARLAFDRPAEFQALSSYVSYMVLVGDYTKLWIYRQFMKFSLPLDEFFQTQCMSYCSPLDVASYSGFPTKSRVVRSMRIVDELSEDGLFIVPNQSERKLAESLFPGREFVCLSDAYGATYPKVTLCNFRGGFDRYWERAQDVGWRRVCLTRHWKELHLYGFEGGSLFMRELLPYIM